MCFPPPLAAERRGPLIGRIEEQRVVEEAISLAADERRAVLVSGEPGIGKTRLLAEIAANAFEAGTEVLLGRCVEELIAPFAPWSDVLRTVIEQGDEGLLTEPAQRVGAVLARLVPELARRFGAMPQPPPADLATERRRLAEAIEDLLGSVAADRPLLIALEDLHWADEGSLAVLSHLLRPGAPAGLVLVGTYRDTELGRRHPLSATLASLRRLPHVTRLSLSGLPRDGLADLVTSLAGHEPDEPFVSALEIQTEGNPFFAKEVLRHLAESGLFERRGGRWVATRPLEEIGLPEGIREVVGRRLSALSDDANRALAAAAVIGAEFDVAILSAVLPQVDVMDALDEAVQAGILRDGPGAAGRYVFSHALVRQTLLGELSGGPRARAHWQVGEALAASRPDRLDDIAFHLTEGVLAGDPGRAVEAALSAGGLAVDRLVPERAVLHYRRALATLDLAERHDPERRWRALTGLAQAASMALATDTTVEACLAAIELAEQMGWVEGVAEAAAQATEAIDFAMPRYETLVPVLERALQAARRPVEQVRLLVARANLEMGRNPVAAREAGAEAMRIAREAGEWSWFLEASAPYWIATSFGLPIEEERALALEVATVAARPDVVAVRRIRPVGNYPVFGRLALALRAGDRGTVEAELAAAESTFFGESRLGLRVWEGMLALSDGRLDDAEATARSLEEQLPGSGTAKMTVDQLRADVLAERGDPRGIELLEAANDVVSPLAALNHRAARSPDLLDGGSRVDDALDQLDATDPSFLTGWCSALAAEAAARYQRPDWAERIEPRLHRLGGVYLSGLIGARIFPIGRALAQVLLVLGRLDEAVAAAESAVATDERFGADALLMRSRQWFGVTLLERRRGDDAERAVTELTMAVMQARRLGYVLVAEECQRLLDR